MNAPSYPISEFSQILRDHYQFDLSPIELAEILWLVNQRGIEYDSGSEELLENIREQADLMGSQTNQNLVDEAKSQSSATANVNVVVDPPSPIAGDKKNTAAATPLPIQIPAAVALRNRREIAKGLRPLMRKVPSRSRQMIDEEATARQIAEDGIWSPVVKPDAERWLELAIVIEVTTLVDVWHDSITEFQHLLERHGAFRDVRTWQLQTSEAGEPQLFLQTVSGLNHKPRSPRELLAASGRRLVLLVSDCTSQTWRSGQMWQLLKLWSRENPVTIGQLLPERYWDRSALGLGSLVTLQSPLPGARSRDWVLPGLSALRFDRLRDGLRIPVITIQPQSIGQWAAAMAAVGEQQSIGVVLRSDAFGHDQVAATETLPLAAKYLVQRFRSTASEKARRLATMMAVLPVNWSVLQLLQKNLVEYTQEDTGALYLAEIFLSGLLCPVPQLDPDKLARKQYDFVEGVRSVLLGGIPIMEAQAIGEKFATEIFRGLPVEVQERVNRDIERRWQGSLSYFEAFLVPDLPWGQEAEAELLPFAQVTDDVLRRWGGEYAAWAEELKLSRDGAGDRSITTKNDFWQTSEVEVTTIEFSDEPVLEPYEFEVATLRMVEDVLELQDVFKIANEAMKAHARKELSALQQEIIEGAWQRKGYAEIADQEGLSTRHVSEVGATLFRSLSQELRKSITKKNMVAAFGQLTGKPTKAGLEIVRVPGEAEQFVELLGVDDALSLSQGVELAMVRIPVGAFMIGSPRGELHRENRESPNRTRTTVPEFYLGKYPVTQAQWRAVANLPMVNRYLQLEPSEFSGDNLPVEGVCWYEAEEFCHRLSVLTGRVYRLPSGAEWEYACRGKTETPFHFGETISSELANYDGRYVYGSGEKGIYRAHTTLVGSLNAANFFGIHDMHGNVYEWCQDYYDNVSPTDGGKWINPDAQLNATRMVRGGCWDDYPKFCRSACYIILNANYHDHFIGFRVVCEVTRTS
jgi:formylglycine-generating enzyme required for sulfatase activity